MEPFPCNCLSIKAICINSIKRKRRKKKFKKIWLIQKQAILNENACKYVTLQTGIRNVYVLIHTKE